MDPGLFWSQCGVMIQLVSRQKYQCERTSGNLTASVKLPPPPRMEPVGALYQRLFPWSESSQVCSLLSLRSEAFGGRQT